MTIKNLAARLDWRATLFLSLTPIFSVLGMWYYFQQGTPSWEILALALFFWIGSSMGVTAGYHRLFSHRAFSAKPWVKYSLLTAATAAFQGTCLKWCTDHRRHHQKVDSDDDPYTISRGFWYAHLGWMILKEDEKYANVFAEDLKRDPVIQFQHDHYGWLATLVGFGLPTLLGWAMGDALGGFVFGGLVRTVLGHHSTFFINSLCHMWGTQPYTKENSAKDNAILAFFTNGEGYHNFHHKFAGDYRNGVLWYQWDPTKWLIYGLSLVGGTMKLKRVSSKEMLRARMDMQQKISVQNGASEEMIRRLREQVDLAQKQFAEIQKEYQLAKKQLQTRSEDYRRHIAAEFELAKLEAQHAWEQWAVYIRNYQQAMA